MCLVGKSGPQGLDACHIGFTVVSPQNDCEQEKSQTRD
jgi:hypothetical protein